MSLNTTKGKYSVGQKLGHWEILETPINTRHRILCRCICGTERRVKTEHLTTGASLQCRSCSSRIIGTKHGESPRSGRTRLNSIWNGMLNRCREGAEYAHIYYDRGIAVCPEWSEDFTTFRDWAISNGYQSKLTLDRRDNERGYNPSNCRWVSNHVQASNKRNHKMLGAFGEYKYLTDWAIDSRCVVCKGTFSARIRKNWPPEIALTTPSDTIKNRKLKWPVKQ